MRTRSLLWVLSSRAWQYTRFLVVVGCLCEVAWERPSCFLVASERCRGERAGFQGAQSPWASGGWCFFGAFPLLSSGRGFLYSHGQTAIRKRQGKSLRLHYDVFGSRRGTSTLNLQSGLFKAQRRERECAVPKPVSSQSHPFSLLAQKPSFQPADVDFSH